jgi:thiol-disulfide isomerase/thioredoxin
MKKILLMLILLLPVLPGCTKKEKPAVVGELAPVLTLRDIAGKISSLSDYRGKVVLLNFWATWCPPCREEIPSMMRLNKAMADKPFQMVAVSIDEGGKAAVEAYFRKTKTFLPVYLDSSQDTARRYGLTGVPETFIIGKRGVIMKKVVGAMDWSDPMVIGYLNEAMK